MIELLEAVTSWKSFFIALLVFGFAPGVLLRVIVRLYPRSDPRRRELVAELYAVPLPMRPIFVVEQLETALCEGVSARWRGLSRRDRNAFLSHVTLLQIIEHGMQTAGPDQLAALVQVRRKHTRLYLRYLVFRPWVWGVAKQARALKHHEIGRTNQLGSHVCCPLGGTTTIGRLTAAVL
ncbi:hypothetical protein [Nocardia cyriacigeorgica]|uniref:hypothetical protein n=1 Tax=Nocardia cyriacigeorgica TaxID=135487 RepID=UPI000CEB65C4|nr:hypothetical protein [Nocardia cyriacigeorgica]AVH20281.1 hypothetical protein C5B73_01160 [Nocardia cyriacigeorgica]